MRLVLGCGVLMVALVAAPAQAAVVAVTDSGLRDPQTRVFTGQRVTFTNLTDVAVTVDSMGRPSFDDVALAPGGEGVRRFIRAGRYRYTAGGRDGVIIVQSFAPALRNGRVGCGDRKVYRYDITVKGRKSVSETWRPEYRNQGAFSISYNYLVSYPGVLLSVIDDCGGGRRLDLPAGPARTASGTGSLSGYTWSDSVSNIADGRPPPCAFATAVTSLGAQVSLEGSTSRGVGGGASLASGLTTPQFGVLAAILDTKHDGVCDKDPGLSNAQVFDGLPGYDASATAIFSTDFSVSSGKLRPPGIALDGDFSAFAQRSNPAIARKLAQGRSFSVATTRTFEDTSSQTTAKGTASISISLRRR